MTILDQIFSDVPEVYRELMKYEIVKNIAFWNVINTDCFLKRRTDVFVILFSWTLSSMGRDFWEGIYEELKYLEENKVKK